MIENKYKYIKTGFENWDYDDLSSEAGGQAQNALDIIVYSENHQAIMELLTDKEAIEFKSLIRIINDLDQEITNRTIAKVLEDQRK
jgi:hypothetical protein